MFGIRFIKVAPTDYVIHSKNGSVVREGAGLAFFYYAPTSSIVVVPMGSNDLPFVFHEVTADFQAVTVQGQMTWRVSDPKRLASLMDFSVHPDRRYVSDDPKKLGDRLVQAAQILTHDIIGVMTLREALVRSSEVSLKVLDALRSSGTVEALGVEVMAFSVVSVRPTPEISKALEAEAREQLLRRSDEATYARRNAAVEQERIIKENELRTEIAIEEKRRQIRETKIAADIAVEEQRKALIDRQAENDRKTAETRAYALEAVLRPVRELDWKTLTALAAASGHGGDARMMVGMAFRELAENAEKIGELNISPDLLRALLDAPPPSPPRKA
jgi:regulator of protease activity HflC (stomatin/prohibitin superfamily)